MAQLKVKQISDFVTAVGTIHNATVGTAAGSAIGTAKSEAIDSAVSQAEAKDVARASTAVVNIATAKSEAIASAEAKDVLRASTAVVNIATAKSEAIASAVSADVVVLSQAKVHSDIQKVRIDALLKDSTDALNTFAEIETFITGLSTADVSQLQALSTAVSNDVVHAAGISANSTAIDNLDFGMDLSLTANNLTNSIDNTNGTGVTLSGANEEQAGLMTADDFRKLTGVEADADVTDYDNVKAAGALMDNEITNLVQVKAFDSSDYATAAQGLLADSALQNASAFDAAGSAADALTAAKSYADTAESDAIASANGYTDDEIAALDTTLRGVIDGVAGTDKTEQLGVFATVASFDIAQGLSLDNNDILVFVNGLQIHRASEGVDGFRTANGRNFTVEGLGYELEADDHIVVVGVAA